MCSEAAQATVALSADFTPNTIFQGDRTRLTITIQNDQQSVLGNATLTDDLPTQVRFYPSTSPGFVAPTTTCTAGTPTAAAGAGPGGVDELQFTGGQIPAAPLNGVVQCTISVDVTSTVNVGAGNTSTYTNQIAATQYSDSINAQATSPLSNSLNVTGLAPPTVGKVFATSPLPQGNNSNVTITLTNPSNSVLPLTTFTDTLPSNLTTASVTATTCTGSALTNTASSVTLTGGSIAANDSCTVTFVVTGVLPANTSTQAGINSFAAGAIGNSRGLTSPAASTNITVNSPIVLTKGFSPTPLSSGLTATFTAHIQNNSTASLTSVGLSDNTTTGWPMQITNVTAVTNANLSAACGGGTLVPGTGGQGFVLSGASIAAGATCDISFTVTSSTVGVWTNSIPAGAVASTQNFFSPAASGSLDVRNTALTVAKSVSPTAVTPGDIVTFTIDVTTFSTSPQTAVSFIDTLPGNMNFVDNSATNGIAPTFTGAGCDAASLVRAGSATAPQFTFNLPAADADGVKCTVKFTARVPTSATPGVTTFINSLPAGSVGNGGVGNTTAVSAGTLTVLQPLTVSKTFDGVAAQELSQGTASVLEIILTNNNYSALSNVAFTDTLPTTPGQIRIANPANATSTCGGTLTANAGDTSLSLSGGSIVGRGTDSPFAPGTCSIRVNVVGGAVGTHTNTIPVSAVTAQGTIGGAAGVAVANTNQAQATLKYDAALTVQKFFLVDPVTSGGNSRVRIQLGNTGNGVLNNVSVNDPLTGSGLTVATPPNASTTCAGPTAITAAAGGASAQLTGATVPAGATCDFLFDVVTNTGTDSVNTIPAGSATADGGVSNTNPASATLHKSASALVLSKAFNPTTISSPGQPSLLTITLTNNGGTTLTNLGIVDALPSGMQVTVVPGASTTCPGGIVGAAAGATSVSLSSGTLAGGGASCTIQVNVTSLVVGTLTNTLPAGIITNNQGVSNALPFSANLSSLAALGIQKSFSPPSVPPNTRARLILQLNNTLAIPLTAISGTDNLPAGLITAVPPNTSTTCAGATVTTTSGSVTFSGATLPANTGNCQVQIDVISATAGVYDNFIPGGSLVANGGNVTNPNPGVHATLNVLNPPTVSKAFAASPVNPGQANRLTVTITNPNATRPLTNLSLKDTLPTGLFVAPTPNASTTCTGGTVSALASATSAQMAGATIAGGASCTFQFDTVSNIAGLYTNTIPAGSITTAEGVTNTDPATANVQILTPPSVVKTFTPPSIAPNAPSQLIITLGNQTTSAQTLQAAFTDTLPPSVVVATPPAIGGSCSTASITAAAGSSTITYANGASVPAGGCTIQVNVTSPTPGTYNNNIGAGALKTNVGSNPAPAVAPLVVSTQGSISGTIYRDDNNDGIHQASEPAFSGQTVNLTGTDTLGNPVSRSTTTDAGGNYAFVGLAAGTYQVTEPSQPAGTLNGKTTVGTIGGVATGAASAVSATPSTISNIVLTSSGAPAVVSSSINNNFGEIVPSDISGFVYHDDDNNGVKSGSETGISGETITLTGTDDIGNLVNLTTTTAADGSYSFTNLRPSNNTGYTVTEGAQPANTDNGKITPGTVTDKTLNTNVGTPGTGITAPPAPATSAIGTLKLPPNATSPNNNFGEISNSRSISGRIYTDNNGDGTLNNADAGVGTGATGAN
ncbi:MAG TPA: SdrD B-like domain-containing protein, partial [Burkholderiales bacterium]